MCTREDAAGVDAGDGSAPAALPIEAKACEHGPPGAVDLIDRRHPEAEPWHFQPAEWAEFVAAVKAGRYDSAGT